ncbi:MAG: sterol desaturase family protein [Alphaproteobacteria bacterium]|nr:sterol desaturase family protein [Alphaproteobacteria bacterium]
MSLFLAVLGQIAHTLKGVLPITAVIGIVFAGLSAFTPCNRTGPWWRKPELITDVCYWFFIPVFGRFARIGLSVLLAVWLLGIHDGNTLASYFENGHGALARLPYWAQCAFYLVVSDFLHYWAHRAFHRGRFWKYHAVHHSSEHLEWISAARFHPFNQLADAVFIDVALLMAGVSPKIFLVLGPFNVFSSALVHANLDWTFGWLKYVFASPVFHRWHHTTAKEGQNRNFAGTFSLFDLMFGTFYMPAGRLPAAYGLDDASYPMSFGPQLVRPFTEPARL